MLIRTRRKKQKCEESSGHSGQLWPKDNSSSLGKGWPYAGVGVSAMAVRPLLAPETVCFTRNSDIQITTPPFLK